MTISTPFQVVLILDVNARISIREVTQPGLLNDPGAPDLIHIFLSDCGAPLPPEGSVQRTHDWNRLGRAVETMAKKAREGFHGAGDRRKVLYVAGKAPLPVFTHLGFAFDRWTNSDVQVVVLNPDRGGPWLRYPLEPEAQVISDVDLAAAPLQSDSAAPSPLSLSSTPPVLNHVDELPATGETSACAALFISTIGARANTDVIQACVERHREALGSLVQVRSQEPGDLRPEHAPALARWFASWLPNFCQRFLRASSRALFIAGPAPLAFLVGRAINPNNSGRIWLANFAINQYEPVLELPFRPSGMPPIPDGPEERLARREVWDRIREGLEQLGSRLTPDDFPGWSKKTDRPRWIAFLRDLRLEPDQDSDSFDLNILDRRVRLGRGLLHAISRLTSAQEPARPSPPIDLSELQSRFGQLLVLHELYHDIQGLRSTHYQDIGRAGVVLEDIDYAADAFALSALIRMEVRRLGPSGSEQVAGIAQRWVEAAIHGIEAFDRFEQGALLERLYERRLRRYLIWHLQRERATKLTQPRDIDELFSSRLFVELAPLKGDLDERYDKLVKEALTRDTELFIAVDRRMVRQSGNKSFDPGQLVEAVRRYDWEALYLAMKFLVDQHRPVLVPWRTDV